MESQNHWFVYDEPLKVESIAQAVSNLAIQFGDSDGDGGGLSRYVRMWLVVHNGHTRRFAPSKIGNVHSVCFIRDTVKLRRVLCLKISEIMT